MDKNKTGNLISEARTLATVVISLIIAKLLKTKTNTSANNAIHFD